MPSSASGNDFDEADIAGALDGIDLDSGEERKSSNKVGYRASERRTGGAGGASRIYESTDKLVSANSHSYKAPSYPPVELDNFMPIKALNQFSTDWVIKARIVKKGDIRNWKNTRGEG